MNDYVDLAESTEIDEEDLSDVERAQAVAARDPGEFTLNSSSSQHLSYFNHIVNCN